MSNTTLASTTSTHRQIHISGAWHGVGSLVAISQTPGAAGSYPVLVVAENSHEVFGRSPRDLFALRSFTDILVPAEVEHFVSCVESVTFEGANTNAKEPTVFDFQITSPCAEVQSMCCAMHTPEGNPGVVICEIEIMTPPSSHSKDSEIKPRRRMRPARKGNFEAGAIDILKKVFKIQKQLDAALDLDTLMRELPSVLMWCTDFDRISICRFDNFSNRHVITELKRSGAAGSSQSSTVVATGIRKDSGEPHRPDELVVVEDSGKEAVRLCGRYTGSLDLTGCYFKETRSELVQHLAKGSVRSYMSMPLFVFGKLWGQIQCHTHGTQVGRIPILTRRFYRLVSDMMSQHLERHCSLVRLRARKQFITSHTRQPPLEDMMSATPNLLNLLNADFGFLSIRDDLKVFGQAPDSQTTLRMIQYLRDKKISTVISSQDITRDFPDLPYPCRSQAIGGLLAGPLSDSSNDFLVFFRKRQPNETKHESDYCGNEGDKLAKTFGLRQDPGNILSVCDEVMTKRCCNWTDEEIETMAVACLVHRELIEMWRQKEEALLNSCRTRSILASTAQRVISPLNAIMDSLETALGADLDHETHENVARSYSASKSLLCAIHDLLDLADVGSDGPMVNDEVFDFKTMLNEATRIFHGEAKRKNITLDIAEDPGLPYKCIGDQRKIRQAISNIVENAIQSTTQGGVVVDVSLVERLSMSQVIIKIAISDSGVGMNTEKLRRLFDELELADSNTDSDISRRPKQHMSKMHENTVGLGLAFVVRVIKNMNGQLLFESREGQGSRVILQLPLRIPDPAFISIRR